MTHESGPWLPLLCETSAGWGGGISPGEVLAAELAAASARLAEVEVTACHRNTGGFMGFDWDIKLVSTLW